MIQKIEKYISENGICRKENKILVAVSGGADSVTLLDLLYKLEYPIGIAHCNFKLRGAEADMDEFFVSELAKKYDIPFYSEHFETAAYAEKEKISIQMAARDLRYQWFEQIRVEEGYDYVAVAHNSDDQIETLLLNLMRGTGIRGITGMKAKSGAVIRPLLFASRNEILAYIEQKKLKYRTDSSNSKDDYSRNYIRHNIIPEFEKLNPGFGAAVLRSIHNFSETEELFLKYIQQINETIVHKKDGVITIEIKPLMDFSNSINTLLFELLRPYGFNSDIVHEIIQSIPGQPGKFFFSPTHRLLKDREFLVIEPVNSLNTDDTIYYLDGENGEINTPINLKWESITYGTDFKISHDKNIAEVDASLPEFPLILRKWRPGDYFMPFGMQNIKKISDFLTDLKLSLSEKEQTWLVCNGDKVIWVVGHRPDNRFRINETTKKIIKFRLI